jgi:ribosomal protein S18 acetylase RimI-like enzyme
MNAAMTITMRPVRATDAEQVASLLTELGYPSTAASVKDRLDRALQSETSRCLVAQDADEVIGLMSAELIPYFPTGMTVCRVTSLVVASQHRRRGIGDMLISAATEFARKHRCSGIEVTSAENRVEAHRFYERIGFSRTAFRFFRAL